MSLNPFKKNQSNIGQPFAPPAIQGFMVWYEIGGYDTHELIESSDTIKLVSVINDLLNEGVVEFLIEKVTIKAEIVQ